MKHAPKINSYFSFPSAFLFCNLAFDDNEKTLFADSVFYFAVRVQERLSGYGGKKEAV
jgi:hypothetical protein